MVAGLDHFWKTNDAWWHLDENGIITINEDAPKKAQESYKHYLEQMHKYKDAI